MSNKREREYERRRYEKWQARQVRADVRRRRQRIVAGAVVAALAGVIAIVAVVAANGADDSTRASAEPTPVAGTSAATEPAALAPDPSVAEDRTWTGEIDLNSGVIEVSLDGAEAPQAVANFVTLAQEGFFDNTSCHRLVTSGIYVLQCGDPEGTGLGGPGYSWGPIENAPDDDFYPAGTIAMARQQDNGDSMGSQFFIVYDDSTIPSDTAGGYTVFGKVTSGMGVIKAIADAGTEDGSEQGLPASDVIIEGVKIQ